MKVAAQFRAKFHESANRPHVLLGCEPTAITAAFVLCVIVAYSAPTLWGIGIAIILFFLMRLGLRAMADEDPILIRVHYEAQRYQQGFWTAKPKQPHRWKHR
jgi:type IV secretory pathway TrbD component